MFTEMRYLEQTWRNFFRARAQTAYSKKPFRLPMGTLKSKIRSWSLPYIIIIIIIIIDDCVININKCIINA